MSHATLTLTIVCSLLVGAVVPVSGLAVVPAASASASAPDPRPVSALDGSAARAQTEDASGSFGQENLTVVRGNEVTISVSHSGAGNLTIGGAEYGFNVTVELGGSGSTEVVLDTRATTASDPSEFVEGGSPTMHSAPLEEAIEPEDYLLRLEVGGVEQDLATLTVEPRGETTAASYRAPASFTPAEYTGGGEDGDADVGALESQMSAGTTVASGDYAVVQFEESGLETALNASDLTGSAAANGLKVNFTQTDPGPNHAAREYVATDGANVSVLPNFANDRIYVLWDTSDVPIETRSGRNRYRAALSLTDESGLVASETTLATTTFTLESPSMSLSPEEDATHYPWENDTFTVTGHTNRAPNTTLEVRLRSEDPNAFLQLRDATVGADGGFEADFDLGSVSRGTNATLWVREYFLQTAQDVYLVAPDPSVRIDDQTANGTSLSVAYAEIPSGGFVRLADESGEPVGRSDYLEPGRHENVAAELSTPLFEAQRLRAELVRADENGSYRANAEPYATDGYVVNDTAVIDFPPAPTETPTATQTATATPTATPTPTPYPVVTRTPLPPAGASQSSLPLSPGVAVAAVLALGALLARRSRGEPP